MELLIGGFLLIVLVALIAAVLWWRLAPTSQAPTASGPTAITTTSPASQPLPSYSSVLTNPLTGSDAHQVKATVSKHALKIERKGGRTLFWFDGVPYSSWQDIPDPTVREQARLLLPQVNQAQADLMPGLVKRRIVVNGVTYNSLEEISDPRLRQAAEEALKKTGH